jgi:hypothetical protein
MVWSPSSRRAPECLVKQTEPIGRHTFLHRRQVLGGAPAFGRRRPPVVLPAMQHGVAAGWRSARARGSRHATEADPRTSNGSRGLGDADAAGEALPVQAVWRDGDGAAPRVRTCAPLRGGCDCSRLRALWARRTDAPSDPAAGLALADDESRLADAWPVALCGGPGRTLRRHTELSGELVVAAPCRARGVLGGGAGSLGRQPASASVRGSCAGCVSASARIGELLMRPPRWIVV